ncbi:MAG: tetratricopeptide repeat protein [Candidatus Aureabacteria bacterium]|nr:tetratricopeptide repeat protein [Candidatus Auribacterota bacterium]
MNRKVPTRIRKASANASGNHGSPTWGAQVESLVREGKLDEAARIYAKFSKGNRGGMSQGQVLARACAAAGHVAIASRVYMDLMRRFPAEYINYKELEKLYLRSGHPRKAVALYQAMGSRHPLKRKSYKRLTGIYWRLGDIRRAIATIRREIQDYGVTPKLGRELGKFYMLDRNHVKAAESFQNVLAQEKGDRDTRVWLGVALMENGNHELAEYEFSELLREKPRDFQARIHMAELRIRENRLHDARKLLDEIDRLHPDNSRVKLCRAEIDFLEGRLEDSRQRGEIALAETPFYYVWEQVRCHRLLAHVYRALHELKNARLHKEMKDALKRSRDVFSGLIRVAELKIRNGELDAGREILERILDLYPGNSRARVALAEAFLLDRNDRRAIEIAEEVLKDIPPRFAVEPVRAHAILAKAYGRLADKEKAAHHRAQRALLHAKLSGRSAS